MVSIAPLGRPVVRRYRTTSQIERFAQRDQPRRVQQPAIGRSPKHHDALERWRRMSLDRGRRSDRRMTRAPECARM
jgi:hypothetical protein